MKEEEFRDVKGYEGLYKVSNLGNVISLCRRVKAKNDSFRIISSKVIKGYESASGYFLVRLYKNKKAKGRTIHSLVAEAFLGHTPNGHNLVVNHIDFNRKNNQVSNLEIVTNRENTNKKHLKSSSDYIGVSWYKITNKWKSDIYVNGKVKHLGYFKCELEASEAYQKALNKINNEKKI